MTVSAASENKVMVVDDEKDMLDLLAKVISRKCRCVVETAGSADAALEKIATCHPEVILTDIKMPGMGGLEFLQKVSSFDPTITTIIMTGYGTIEMAVQALKDGAYDFFEKPFDNDKITHAVTRALERTVLLRENLHLQHRLTKNDTDIGFIGRSRKMVETLNLLKRLAPSKATVLIRGESGTGKELAARALHLLSDRAERRLITVNCPALPEQILESELFGYKKGAFTGADRDKTGLFVEASGSTILLDEVADIPVSIQTKLLRVLQEKEVQPLGQTRTYKVDVRVIASTNQDLEAKIASGEFREDLFYRLNVMTVTMPSLSSMVNDVPLLAQHFLELYSKEHGREHLEFEPEALQCLIRRKWKGNVRELQNVINRAVLLCHGFKVDVEDLHNSDFCIHAANTNHHDMEQLYHLEYKQAKNALLEHFNSSYLGNALQSTGGNVTVAAKGCGMERQALQRLMRKYKIEAKGFR